MENIELKSKTVTEQCDKILKQIGCHTINLSSKESARKKFYKFVRDYGITSYAYVNYDYKNFRYLSEIKNKESSKKLSAMLFEHATLWYGYVDNCDKLYFVSQPFYNFMTIKDVLNLFLAEKGFLDFCKSKGHKITIDFDNTYNWRGDNSFVIIVELETEGSPSDFLDICLIDWGNQKKCCYRG